MAKSHAPPIEGAASATSSLDALSISPAEAHRGLSQVETLGRDVTELSVFRPFTEVMPAADFLFGGGMLMLIMLVHATGMRFLTNNFDRRVGLLVDRPSSWKPDLLLGRVVVAMLVLHLAEIFIWSAALVYSGLVANWRAAGFFAANTYTTVGYGNFVLPDGWHMLAPIIAMSGLFTFGWTGSVLVEVVRRCQEAKAAAAKAAKAHASHRSHPPPAH